MIHLVISTLLVASSQAAWMTAEIGSMSEKAMCATLGDIQGPVIAVCGENGPLYLYRWTSDHWSQERIQSGSDYPTTATIADLAGNGTRKLYLGSSIRNELVELSPSPNGSSGWIPKTYRMPAGALNLSIARSNADGRPHLIIDSYTANTEVSPCAEGSDLRRAIYDCHFENGSLKYNFVGRSCGRSVFFNPKGIPGDRDIIVGQEIWQRLNERWTVIGSIKVFRNLAISQHTPGRVFTDRTELQFSSDFSAVKSTIDAGRELQGIYMTMEAPGIFPISGAYRALIPATIRADSEERLYSADNERMLHEQTRTPSGWSRSDSVGEFRGIADFLITGDGRGDGRQRLYVVHNGAGPDYGKSWLSEVDYFPKNPVVAALDVTIRGSSAPVGVEGILGDLLRSEMARSKHIVMIDAERMSGVLQERRFQQSQCRSTRCLADFGKLLEADVTVQSILERNGDSYSLTCSIVDAFGHKGPEMRRSNIAQKKILAAIRSAASDLALMVPYATSLNEKE